MAFALPNPLVRWSLPRLLPAAASWVLWTLAGASLVAWALKLGTAVDTAAEVAPVVAPAAAPVDSAAVARALGAVPAGPAIEPTVASRLSLQGVIASRSKQGAALIAVDGKPARPFRVGTPVVDGLVLLSVAPRRAELGERQGAAPSVVLEMPAAPKP